MRGIQLPRLVYSRLVASCDKLACPPRLATESDAPRRNAATARANVAAQAPVSAIASSGRSNSVGNERLMRVATAAVQLRDLQACREVQGVTHGVPALGRLLVDEDLRGPLDRHGG